MQLHMERCHTRSFSLAALNPTRIKSEYSTGITPNVSAVAKNKPKIIAMAIGSNIEPPPYYNGSIPPIVVQVVRKIGRKRPW